MASDEKDFKSGQMSTEELARLCRLDAIPIDFDGLIEAGALEKKGAWYVIRDRSKVPEHALRKVKAMKTPNLVRFRKHSAKNWEAVKRKWPDLARRIEAEADTEG